MTHPDTKAMDIETIRKRIDDDYYVEDGGFIFDWLASDIKELVGHARLEGIKQHFNECEKREADAYEKGAAEMLRQDAIGCKHSQCYCRSDRALPLSAEGK